VVQKLHPLFEDLASHLPWVQCWKITAAVDSDSSWDQNGIKRGRLWQMESSKTSSAITKFTNAACLCHVSSRESDNVDHLHRLQHAYTRLFGPINDLLGARLAMESYIELFNINL
jgi:hypothetical protein